jgi:sialidase-1
MLRHFRYRWSCLLIPLLGSLLAAPTAALGQALEQHTVFQRGEGGYHTFRIPAIVQANNGTLLAFAEGRVNSGSDFGNIDVVLKRSSDGGKTWGPLQLIHSNGTAESGNPAPVVVRSTGNIILPFTIDRTTPQVRISTDSGATWSSAIDISPTARLATWDHYAFGPNHGIQLERGPNAGRLVIPGNHTILNQPLNPAGREAHVVYSDDGGLSWQVGGILKNTSGAINPNESTVVELVDGRIYMNSRNQGGDERYRLFGYSSDSGLTFPQPAQIEYQLVDPQVQGSLERYSAVDKGDAQNRILFSNPATATLGLRRRMTVKSSFDETATWNDGKMIHRGFSAYSDLVALNNGAVGLLYEHGLAGNYERIQFARWEAGWLDDPSIVHLKLDEHTSGAAPGTAGFIRDAHGNGLHATFFGAPQYVAGDPRYGNGSALRFTGSTDHLRITDTNFHMLDFEAVDSFTLEVLFRTTEHGDNTTAGSGPLIAKDVGPASPSYWLRVQNGRLRFLVSDGTSEPNLSSSVLVNDGQWHHAAAIRDADTGQLRLYVDYELVGTITDTTTGDFANANHLLIGAFNASGVNDRQFIGDIDFVRISSGALAPDQFVQMIPEPASAVALLLSAAVLLRRRFRPS